MQIPEQLVVLQDHTDEAIARAAQKTLEYTRELEAGELSKQDYAELLQDLASDQRIAAQADNLETAILLEKVIKGLISIASKI